MVDFSAASLMAPFKLEQIVLFWLVRLMFQSDAQPFTREVVRSSRGINFVFCTFPKAYLHIQLETVQSGRICYHLKCRRNCRDRYYNEEGHLIYPELKNIALPKSEVGLLSGKENTVFTVSTTLPVTARMVVFYNNESIAATYLLPLQILGSNYYYMTTYTKSRIAIVSLKYTLTLVRIFLKDNVEYKKERPPSSDPLPQKGEMRRQGYPAFDFDKPSIYDTKVSPMEMKLNEWNTVSLHEYESFFLQDVADISDLTGSQVTSDHPVLMLQGADEQSDIIGSVNSDLFLDTAPPEEAYGKFYIVYFCHTVNQRGDVKVLTQQDSNKIKIEGRFFLATITLQKASDWFHFTYTDTAPVFIVGEYAINVLKTISLSSACDGSQGPCMTSVVPVERWSSSYRWTYPSKIGDADFFSLFSLIVETEHEANVTMDGSIVASSIWLRAWSVIAGNRSFSYACEPAQAQAYNLYMTDSRRMTFFVTLAACSKGSSFCSAGPADFQLINAPSCEVTYTEPGDLLDNDCDGRFDEEIRNNIDDDEDSRIDEDLEPNKAAPGGWGEWSGEKCRTPCGETTGEIVRTRECNNPATSGAGTPCIGEERYRTDNACDPPYIMPSSECLAKRWGFNCTRKCDNCGISCDKKYGTCEKCKNGFTSKYCNESCPEGCLFCTPRGFCIMCEELGVLGINCDKVCPDTMYGQNCSLKCSDNCIGSRCRRKTGACLECPNGLWGHNCTEPCKDDCEICWVDTGTCWRSYSFLYLLIIMLFALLLALIAYIFTRTRKRSDDMFPEAEGDWHYGEHEFFDATMDPFHGYEWHFRDPELFSDILSPEAQGYGWHYGLREHFSDVVENPVPEIHGYPPSEQFSDILPSPTPSAQARRPGAVNKPAAQKITKQAKK